ncbi:hypothetical protein ACTXT7_013356 [Hymenolepis weldensis]
MIRRFVFDHTGGYGGGTSARLAGGVIGYGASGADDYGGCTGEVDGDCNGAFGFGGALVKVVVMNFMLTDVHAVLAVLLVVLVMILSIDNAKKVH